VQEDHHCCVVFVVVFVVFVVIVFTMTSNVIVKLKEIITEISRREEDIALLLGFVWTF